jgi:acetylornithine deacetylase/succinyl-diaminopimelate desuccinylase-like protein
VGGGGALNAHPATDPELFRADAMLIADMGSLRPGLPTLTVALRGMANVTVGTTTLASGKHSGQYGGAAPDAQIALLHALASLHDENGDVSVPGLLRDEWKGGGMHEDEFRKLAEIEGDLPLKGTGGIGSRLWSGSVPLSDRSRERLSELPPSQALRDSSPEGPFACDGEDPPFAARP